MSENISKKRKVGFDPKSQPVMPISALPKLPDECLNLDYIRSAFQRPVNWHVDSLFINSFMPNCVVGNSAREAAVLIPFVQRGNDVNILFTRRSDHLNDHAGQISFPGGRIELFDKSPVAAAVRETHEEIGVEQQYINVMGTQPTLLTTTDFLMTPIIGELLPGFNIKPDASEVAEVFEVPLQYLMDPESHRVHQLQIPSGHGRYYFSITWQSHFIWGATAVLVRNFYHFLAASLNSK